MRGIVLISCMLLAASLAFGIALSRTSVVRPELVLAVLVAAGAALSAGEFAPLVILALWGVNWQPAIGWDLLWFGVVAFSLGSIVRAFPWRMWISVFAGTFLAAFLFALGTSWGVAVREPAEFVQYLLYTAGVSVIAHLLIRGEESGASRR